MGGVPGLASSHAASAGKFGPVIHTSQSGATMQARKSILPQMDYTNKYVQRH